MTKAKQRAKTVGEFLKVINVIFLALVLGQILFAAIMYFQILPNTEPDNSILMTLLLACIGLSVFGIFFGHMIFRKKINSRARAGFREKLKNYQTAFIIRMATLEAPSLIAIICAMLAGNPYFLIFSFLLILVQIMYRPSASKITRHLKLDFEEKRRLNNNNTKL